MSFCQSVLGQSGYEPFLIAPLQTGKSIGMAPWLSPIDAFPTLQNARVNKGVLEKRLGYQLFATMLHGSTPQTSTAIMGIHLYLKSGLPQLLIFDVDRVNRYNPVDSTMTDITGGSDIFTGGNDDFFHFANWLGVGYMTNNVDQIYQYSGSGNVAVFNAKVDSSTEDNHIDTCRITILIPVDSFLPKTTDCSCSMLQNMVTGCLTDAGIRLFSTLISWLPVVGMSMPLPKRG
jgi:hypothetical protein